MKRWWCVFCVFLLTSLGFGTNAAIILQYHHISDLSPPATSISPARFERHLQLIEQMGYTVVSLPDWLAQLRQNSEAPLPDKQVVLTFDDAYRSVYDTAFPLLKARGWPFTVFVQTQPVDARSGAFVRWDELREMAAAGATIANHSVSHAYLLRRLSDETESDWRDRIEQEILGAQARIDAEVPNQGRLFAYPYGEFNHGIKEILAQHDFISFAQHSGPAGKQSDRLALPRFAFGGIYGDDEDFLSKLQSLPLPLAEPVSAAQTWALAAGPFTSADGVWSLPDQYVLPKGATAPILRLELATAELAARLQCYASGQGATAMQRQGRVVYVQAMNALPVGRSRYNCTAPGTSAGRYFWLAQPWLTLQADGQWPPE